MRIFLLFTLLLTASPAAFAVTKASYQHYLKALLLTNRGKYSEALLEYEIALKLDPNSAFMNRQAAEICLEMGRLTRALSYAKRVVELSPEDSESHHLIGNVFWAQGDIDAAKAAFEKTLKLKPGHEGALFALGNLLSADSPDRAKEYLRDYIEENPADASEAEYHIALIEQKAGNMEGAIEHYRASIDAYPDNMQARYGLAQLYEVRRDTEAALAEYVEILSRDARNVLLINHVGEMYYMSGRIPEARTQFLRAKEIVPSHPVSCLWLALIAESEKDYKAAVGFVSDSAALSEDAGLNLRLSYYLTQANRLDEAVAVLEKAHQRWPENEEVSYFLALGYDDLDKPRKAIELLKAVVEASPEHRDALFQLGAAYEKIGDMEGSEKAFRTLLKAHPKDASALNYLGYSLADRGLKLDEAERLIRRAIELSPDNGAYVDSLGWVQFKLGRHREALKELERAAELLPGDETIWVHVGDVHSVLEQNGEAWEAWKSAQAVAGPNAGVDAKLSRVEAGFSSDELGRRYLEFLARTRGRFASFGGPCLIEGGLGGKSFKFNGILHFRSPRDLSVDVLGPLFSPMFKITLSGASGFEMDPLEIEGVDPSEMRNRLFGALDFLRTYLDGAIFDGRPAEHRRAWRKSRVETPEASFTLDKSRVRLSEVRGSDAGGFNLELSDYKSVEGRWVPATLKLGLDSFSLVFRLSEPTVRFR